jgi:RNA recognition motif-containing protein
MINTELTAVDLVPIGTVDGALALFLGAELAGCGQVNQFRILVDRETNRSRGMGFCEFGTQEECQSAIDSLNGHEIHGRQLRVDHARPRN